MSYSEHERDLLMNAASEVLVAAVAADRTGLVAYFQEMLAAGRYLYDAQRRYAHNRLIQALFAERDSEPRSQEGQAEPSGATVTSERLLKRLSEVGAILRDDEEGREFKEFLLGLALEIARASGSPFGSRISEGEAEFIRELKSRLGMEPESA